MDTIIFLIGVAAIIVVYALLAYVVGWLFTEVVRLPLNFKPFTCRPCLTFWATVVLGVICAYRLAPYFPCADLPVVRQLVTFGLAGVSVLAGLVNFLYIKLKFRIYE